MCKGLWEIQRAIERLENKGFVYARPEWQLLFIFTLC